MGIFYKLCRVYFLIMYHYADWCHLLYLYTFCMLSCLTLLTVSSVDGQICTFFGLIGTISLATSEFTFMKRSYASEISSPSRNGIGC